MKFDLLTGGQEFKLAILVKYCLLQVNFFLFLSLFTMVSSNFEIIK